RAAARTPGWEAGLADAAQFAGGTGDSLSARWSAWLLVETLAADGRLAEAAQAAGAAAGACLADLAYSWQTRFLAAGLWCLALRGDASDEVVTRATELTDRTLPALARWAAYDSGILAADEGQRPGDPGPVRATLDAWAAADPQHFDLAAQAWHDLARREEVRCLLAHGLRAADPADAVPPLLRAEALA